MTALNTPTSDTASKDLSAAYFDRLYGDRYIGVGLSTLAGLTAAGSLPSFGVKRRLYRVADLQTWLEALVTNDSNGAC